MRDMLHGCYFIVATHLICKSASCQSGNQDIWYHTNNSSGLVVEFSHGHFNQTAKDLDIHGSIGKADRALQSQLTGIKRFQLKIFPLVHGRRAFHMLFSSILEYHFCCITYVCFSYFLLQAYFVLLHFALLQFIDVVFILFYLFIFYKLKARPLTS